MKAFIKILYAVLALGILAVLIDNKFSDGSHTGINKHLIDKTAAWFSGTSYDPLNVVVMIHQPDENNCMYYLKNEMGDVFLPELLEEKYHQDGLRVRVHWKELIKVQDECRRGTFVRIEEIEKF